MYRTTALAASLAAGLFFFEALSGGSLDAWVQAPLAAAAGVSMAALLFGEASAVTVALGALSPVALVWLSRESFAWGVAAMAVLWLVPRLLLVRTRTGLLALALLSVAAAILAGNVVGAFAAGTVATRLASCLFAGCSLSLVTVLVRTDTPIAHSLLGAASAIEGPSQGILERAAEAHNQLRGDAGASGRTWRGLVKLAEARASLRHLSADRTAERASELDARIAAVVSELVPVHA